MTHQEATFLWNDYFWETVQAMDLAEKEDDSGVFPPGHYEEIHRLVESLRQFAHSLLFGDALKPVIKVNRLQ